MNASNQAPEAEELNLQELLGALRRRWPFILAGLALGGVIAAWTTSRTKPTWEGTFDILLASQKQSLGVSGLLNSSPMLANLAGLGMSGSQGSEIETELKILQSASVLKPVFEEVRDHKTSLGHNTAGYGFKSWAGNLKIERQPGTSVLSISYRDTDKNLILPVLRSVSNAYQNYSMRERNDSLKNAIKYAEEQKQIYRARADTSFRALNSYGLTYGISPQITGGGGGTGGIDISKLISPTNSGAALNLSKGRSTALRPNGTDPLAQLAQLNQELIRREQTFTQNDPGIIALKKERNAIRSYIERSAFGSIAYPGKRALSKEQAQNIVLNHQELERKANRDQSTLDSLESAVLSLQLEQARAGKPWELISTPTLLERPVSPRPRRNLGLGLASGMIIGCVAAFIADKCTGKVFSKETFVKLLENPLLLELPSDQVNAWSDGLRLLGLNNSPGGSIAIFALGEVQANALSRIRDILKQTRNENIEICSSIFDATKFDSQLLVAAPGSIKKIELELLIQELNLHQTPIIGWIWLDSI